MKYVIIFDSTALFLKVLYQMVFASYSFDRAINPNAENELDIML